ncbi:Phytosulfokines 3 [Senna tora]|uniref:Phytosulfokine n=1 Tax=Senna tora TaxID=362788 RepID=A0A834XA63_9FABA|nr:Phytosulfokines 3 [Senna tora]
MSSKAKASIFMLAFFFFLFFFFNLTVISGRPLPSSSSSSSLVNIPDKTQHEVMEVEKLNEEESCEGAAEEECLMRRTLAAHLDYIYTQNQKP